MGLIDNARRLANIEYGPVNSHCRCHWCDQFSTDPSEGHAPDCPWLAMPRILTALEAAERVVDEEITPHYFDEQSERSECAFCGEEYHLRGHAPDCLWQALVAALRGEEVTA